MAALGWFVILYVVLVALEYSTVAIALITVRHCARRSALPSFQWIIIKNTACSIHGMDDSDLQTVYRSIVIAKLT